MYTRLAGELSAALKVPVDPVTLDVVQNRNREVPPRLVITVFSHVEEVQRIMGAIPTLAVLLEAQIQTLLRLSQLPPTALWV